MFPRAISFHKLLLETTLRHGWTHTQLDLFCLPSTSKHFDAEIFIWCYYILYVQISAAFAMYAPTCVIAYSDVSVKVMFYLCHWEDFLKWLANHKPDRHWQSLCQGCSDPVSSRDGNVLESWVFQRTTSLLMSIVPRIYCWGSLQQQRLSSDRLSLT